MGDGQSDKNETEGCGTSFSALYWLNIEPCGIICASITWCIVLYCEYAVTFHVIMPWLNISVWGVFHMLLFNGCAWLALTSHMKAMTTNPGAVPRNALPLHPSNTRRCRRCDVFKPPRAHHCSLCNRCIVRMDHHCPWVNNCVGLGNHKFFILFCSYVCFISGYAIFLMFLRYTSCLGLAKGCMTSSGALAALHLVMVLVLAMLFGLFTFCMVCEQVTTISTNQTTIDRMQGGNSEANSRSALENMTEVFGGKGMSIWWLLPTDPFFPDRELVYGYIVDEENRPLAAGDVMDDPDTVV